MWDPTLKELSDTSKADISAKKIFSAGTWGLRKKTIFVGAFVVCSRRGPKTSENVDDDRELS